MMDSKFQEFNFVTIRVRLLGRTCLAILALCVLPLCSGCDNGFAAASARTPLRITCDGIRIKLSREREMHQAEVSLQVYNQSNSTYCVLPTESRLNYSIEYDNAEVDCWGAESALARTPTPRNISDLDLPRLTIAPGTAARLKMALSVGTPKGRTGRLELEYQCKPAYEGTSYRGVPICRDTLRTSLDVVIVRSPGTDEVVIRAIEKRKRKG